MADSETVYEIMDGVRRAKAALICGRDVIAAQINGVGTTIVVPLSTLRSPKREIDVSGVRGISWGKILRATQNGVHLPLIEIVLGTRGLPITEVIVEDVWDVFKQP